MEGILFFIAGSVAEVDLCPTSDETAKASKNAKETLTKIKHKDVNELHAKLGHPSKDISRATGTSLGFIVMEKFAPCKDCAISKAKQTKTNKVPIKRSKNKGKRLFLDISLPQTTSIGGMKHWLLVLDDCTDLAWSYFLKNKSDLKNEILALIKESKAKFCITVKYIRCNNAGENIALEKA